MAKLQNNSKLEKKSSPKKQSSHVTPLPIFVVSKDSSRKSREEGKKFVRQLDNKGKIIRVLAVKGNQIL